MDKNADFYVRTYYPYVRVVYNPGSILYFQLHKSYEELNKRIFEHDKCMAEGKIDKQEVTLQVKAQLKATGRPQGELFHVVGPCVVVDRVRSPRVFCPACHSSFDSYIRQI